MAELDVSTRLRSNSTYEATVTNLGPDTVILSKIEATGSDDNIFAGPPLHRVDLELIRGARHRFDVVPSLAHGAVVEVDVTFTDETGERTKTYPLYLT